MHTSIDFRGLSAESADGLAEKLRGLATELEPRLSVDDPQSQPDAESAFLLFWGPPNRDQSEVETVLEAIPTSLPAIGASAEAVVVEGRREGGKWGATCVISRYMTAHAAFSELERRRTAGVQSIEACIERFIETLNVREYFTDRAAATVDRTGAHNVRYNRPAFLLLFLPGMGADPNQPWPAGNQDHQIIECLSRRASPSLPFFGSSAAGIRPPDEEDTAWLAASWGNGSRRATDRGVVGILVETDLAFGCACAHGFELHPDTFIRVEQVEATSEIQEPLTRRRSRPARYHIATKFAHSPRTCPFEPLDIPSTQNAQTTPRLGRDRSWDTLVVFGQDDVFPNPPYRPQNGGDTVVFLRPVSVGATLYHATAKYDNVMQAAEKAVEEATTRGNVRRPEGAFLADCRGRLALLGEAGIDEEMRPLQNGLKIFGMYGVGETCPSRLGVNSHWNWTAAALVLGGDFNREYESAATSALLGRVDRAIAEPHELEHVLEELVAVTAILLQTDCCHIRMLSADGEYLELKDGVGRVYEVVPQGVDLSPDSPHSALVAYDAFKKKTYEVLSGEDYRKRVRGTVESIDGWRRTSDGSSPDHVLEKVQWWTSYPIVERGQCLGVLSVDSLDPQFLATGASKERAKRITRRIADMAALPIRVALMRSALERALMNASAATSPVALAKAIVDEGAELLGRDAYLSLLLPDNLQTPTELTCAGCRGPDKVDPENVRVRLGDVPAVEKGICGWVFEHGEPYCSDNAPEEANGRDGKPQHKACIPGVKANYVFPLIDPERPGGGHLGVLNAEAHANVLDKSIHGPFLDRLAKFCVPVVKRHYLEDLLWGHLKRLLPREIHHNLREKHGEGLDTLAPPERRVTTLLYADIRGYTKMSQIIGEELLLPFVYEYYRMVTVAVAASGGTLDKFTGDGVLALYGNFDKLDKPLSMEEESPKVLEAIESAIEAGLTIADDFKRLAGQWLPRWRRECPEVGSEYRFEIGVAIHTGKPIVGLFTMKGDNGGYLTYTAIGRDVNLVARIGDAVDRNSVWVSASTWELLRKSSKFKVFAKSQSFELRGVAFPIEAFEVQRE